MRQNAEDKTIIASDEYPKIRTLSFGALAVVIFALSLLLVSLFPAQAHASRSYEIDSIDTELFVQTNAQVQVIQRQTLSFSGNNEGASWYLYAPKEFESVKINSIRIAALDSQGNVEGDWTKLQMVDVDMRRQGETAQDAADAALRTPDTQPWYSYNLVDGVVRCYFPTDAQTYLVEADYLVRNAVKVYNDVAELTWRYAFEQLPVPADHVTLRVSLPVPYDAQFVAGEDVMAWTHGNVSSQFFINTDGSLDFSIENQPVDTYSDARVIFPASWMTNMIARSPVRRTEVYKPQVLEEETNWIDSATRGAIWDNNVRVIFLIFASICVLIACIGAIRWGRSYRSRRLLGRIACTLAIVALFSTLFFKEPLTVVMLLLIAFALGVIAFLFFPSLAEEQASEETEESVEDEFAAEEEAVEEVDVEEATSDTVALGNEDAHEEGDLEHGED